MIENKEVILTEIKGLEYLINLKSLILSRNHILEIKGLQSLKKLTHLFLDHNQITEIKELENLINSKSLYHINLQDNRLSKSTVQLTRREYPDLIQL